MLVIHTFTQYLSVLKLRLQTVVAYVFMCICMCAYAFINLFPERIIVICLNVDKYA